LQFELQPSLAGADTPCAIKRFYIQLAEMGLSSNRSRTPSSPWP
jgi:hypothetical protein